MTVAVGRRDPAPSIVLLHDAGSSRLTWWRIEQDLHDLGWDTQALDLLGHGERSGIGPEELSLQALTDDVLERLDRPIDVLAGHGLGAVVALLIARRRTAPMRAMLLEDPLGGSGVSTSPAWTDLAASALAAATDPLDTRTHLLADNPMWAQPDADGVVAGRQRFDADRIVAMLRAGRWDLPSLLGGSSVPVHLLLADRGSALDELDRGPALRLPPPGRMTVVASGHALHRDRPALWVHHVERVLASIDAARPRSVVSGGD